MASRGAVDAAFATPTDTAWTITGQLIAGMMLYGGIGWLLGLWLGHQPLFIAAGVLFGIAASLYLVLTRLNYETHGLKETNRRDSNEGLE